MTRRPWERNADSYFSDPTELLGETAAELDGFRATLKRAIEELKRIKSAEALEAKLHASNALERLERLERAIRITAANERNDSGSTI